MTNPTRGIEHDLAAVRAAWSAALPGVASRHDDDLQAQVDAMTSAGLVAVGEAIAQVRRDLDALHVRVAAGIARRSTPEFGADGLARKQGYRSPAGLVAAATGGSTAEAVRLVAVGQATASSQSFSGSRTPARHPHVAAAVEAGSISIDAAAAITHMLDRVAPRADRASLEKMERLLARRATTLTLDHLHRLIRRGEAHLDPDGVKPREDALFGLRSLHLRQERCGMIAMTARLDPETAAPIKTAIEALVTHWLRRNRRDHVIEDSRSLPQLQADALAELARHAITCTSEVPGVAGRTVVIRTSLDDLRRDLERAAADDGGSKHTGFATVDGIDQPISAGTVRRLAAAAGIIPLVLGGRGEVLDQGREKRLFTKAQRIALAERDGGCAICALPPGYTEAHHIDWWELGHGSTDLENGVLLCSGCHHRVHDDGWTIQIRGPEVWFIPPPHVDPTGTPRQGGRARYDLLEVGAA